MRSRHVESEGVGGQEAGVDLPLFFILFDNDHCFFFVMQIKDTLDDCPPPLYGGIKFHP